MFKSIFYVISKMSTSRKFRVYYRIKVLRFLIKGLQAREKALQDEAGKMMENNKLFEAGVLLAEITHVPGAIQLDGKALKTGHPEIYNQFLKQGKGSFRFYLK
jgi:hypothetical protein